MKKISNFLIRVCLAFSPLARRFVMRLAIVLVCLVFGTSMRTFGYDFNLLVADQNSSGGALISIDPDGNQSVISSGDAIVNPVDVVVGPGGDIFMVDASALGGPGAVFRIDRSTGTQTALSFGGDFLQPYGIALDSSGDLIVVDADTRDQNGNGFGALFRIDAETGEQMIISRGGMFYDPHDVAIEASGDLIVADANAFAPNRFGAIFRVDPITGDQFVVASGGRLHTPVAVDIDASGNLIVVDRFGYNAGGNKGAILRLDPASGTETVITTNGLLNQPYKITIDQNGDYLIGNYEGGNIVRVTPAGVQSVEASGGALDGPLGVALDTDADDDGLVYDDELEAGTSPADPDSDGDTLLDGTEVDMAQGGACPDPLNPDSDGDSLSDGEEVVLGTNLCSADTDGDGLNDDFDPLPLDPGVTSGYLEDALRELAEWIDGLPLDVFDAKNDNARAGRRNALSNKANAAANAVHDGDYEDAIAQLESMLLKLDGDPSPPDWIVADPVRAELRDSLELLIELLELG